MRAVVVLLLLIANAIVASRNSTPAEPAPVAPTEFAPTLLATLDGASPLERRRAPEGPCLTLRPDQMHL